MEFKKFTSPNSWFVLTIPEEWEASKDEDEGTYGFYNAKEWTGNFRITPFRWTDAIDLNEDKAAQFIADEIKENSDAKKLMIREFDCAFYKEEIKQDDEDFVIYYWALGRKVNLFLCSFTIKKTNEETEQNKLELELVGEIIKSIEII